MSRPIVDEEGTMLAAPKKAASLITSLSTGTIRAALCVIVALCVLAMTGCN